MGLGEEYRGSLIVAAFEEAARAERARLASALHDDALQTLIAARQDLEEVEDRSEELDLVRADLGQVVEALRGVTAALDEDGLDRVELREALRRIADDIARRAHLSIAIEVSVAAAAGAHDRVVRAWVRELLANVAKHARATHVDLAVGIVDDRLEIAVTDDGVGPQAGAVERAAEEGHVGLARARRSARELGGTFSLVRVGDRTSARVRLPLEALAAQDAVEAGAGSEQRWSSSLLAAFREPLMVVRAGRIVHGNDAFCALAGAARGCLLGSPADDVLAVPGSPGTTIGTLRRIDGSTVEVEVDSQPVTDALGDDAGTLVVARDLTARRSEESRARTLTELDSTIETARRLSALQRAARHGTDAVLHELGGIVSEHLGWSFAVLNRRTAEGYVVVLTRGDEVAVALQDAEYSHEELDRYTRPRYAENGCFVVREEDVRPGAPEMEPRVYAELPDIDDPNAERPEDVVMVPLRNEDGTLLGLLSVAGSRTGLRPTATELEVLATIADHAAIALTSTQAGKSGDAAS